MQQINTKSLVATLGMLLATLIFQGKRETFAGWETGEVTSVPRGFDRITAESVRLSGVTGIADSEPPETVEERASGKASAGTGEASVIAAKPPEPLLPTGLSLPERLVEQFLAAFDLTTREKDILVLLFKGRNNPYIREQLNISNNTLKTHLRNVYQKLCIGNRQELLSLFDSFAQDQTG